MPLNGKLFLSSFFSFLPYQGVDLEKVSFLRMSATHSEGNDFDFFVTLETTGLLSFVRRHIKEADQRLRSSPSDFLVLMITSRGEGGL